MATQTTNYNLIKPGYTDPVDVDVLNDNSDLIDSALTAKANLVGGKVPASELPSYVDDVIEGYYYNGAFYTDVAHTDPITGEQGKIYIDLSTETCFRWSGSVYVQISSPDADFYWCTYDTTLDAQGIAEAYAELTAAFTAGRILVFYNSQRLFICNYYIGGNDPKFYFMSYDDSLRVGVTFGSNTGWSSWVTAIMATKQYVDNAIAEAGQLPQGTNEGDILYWDDANEVWASGDITNAATFDSTPTQNSLNPVTSGGVYDAIQAAGGLPSGTNVGDILVWNGTSWVAQQPSRLPAGYREVEYVEGGGTQYIKFDYTPQLNDKWELDCQFTGDVSTGNYGTNGAINNASGTMRRIAIGYWNGAFQAAASETAEEFGTSDNNRHTFVLDTSAATFSVDSTVYALSSVTIGNISKFCFFARIYQDGVVNTPDITSEKIYGSKIMRGAETLFLFVPCYNIYNNEIGMYDIVNNQFYTNAGTGTFIKGPDV